MKTAKQIVDSLPTPTDLKSLHAFFKAIPDKFWCVQIRDDGEGHHCALGFLDLKFLHGYISYQTLLNLPITNEQLAVINNGTDNIFLPSRPDPKAKTRVLAFLRKLMKERAKI